MIRRVIEFLEGIKEVSPHAEPILVISITAILGLLFGSIKIRGIKLGVAGMLFSGLLLGHFGLTLEKELLSFLKEFGLALFVFTVGLQLGPGFFNSLKKDGLKLNALAVLIVLSGAALVFVFGHFVLGWNTGALAGDLFRCHHQHPLARRRPTGDEHRRKCGLREPGGDGLRRRLSLRRDGHHPRDDPDPGDFPHRSETGARRAETATFPGHPANPSAPRSSWKTRTSTAWPIRNMPGVGDDGVVVSRIRRRDETGDGSPARDTVLHAGDVILAVGSPEQLERATLSIGQRVDEDLRKAPGNVTAKRVIVTHKDMIGKTIAATRISERFGVTVSRVSRQDMILTAMPDLRLQFGDMLNLVGEEAAIEQAAKVLGNSVHQLNETSFASIFIGITVGILFGLYPWSLPGVPVPLRLGLAGGPLIIAILMGRLGRVGPLVIHMPINANTAFRELGIIFFLACVGLGAGGKFAETAFSSTGLQWMAMGAVVTTVPLMIAGIIGRKVMKINYLTLSGVLAGSMTDPPALAFSTKLTNSDYPSLAYANVYPLTMLMRILVAQIAVLWLC